MNRAAGSETEPLDADSDIALAEDLKKRYDDVRAEVGKIIRGQENVVELVLLTVLVGGNSLIVGVPGLAKTLLIHTLAQVLDLSFSRIQFTPDLMPSDITGTDLVRGEEPLEFWILGRMLHPDPAVGVALTRYFHRRGRMVVLGRRLAHPPELLLVPVLSEGRAGPQDAHLVWIEGLVVPSYLHYRGAGLAGAAGRPGDGLQGASPDFHP